MGIIISDRVKTCPNHQNVRNIYIYTITYNYITISKVNKQLIIEGSLEAKLPTIWTVETQSREEAERREKIRRKKR